MLGINPYDEYGKPGASNIGRFQYTGQKWWPDGAYDYKARMYAPAGAVPADRPDRLRWAEFMSMCAVIR